MNRTELSTPNERLSLLSAFALIVLIFSITRGLVPILTGNGGLAQPVYHASAMLGIMLSCYGLYLALFAHEHAIGTWPRLLLVINLVLYMIWLVPVIIITSNLETISQVIYLGLFPFSIYGLVNIPEKKLIRIIGLLTLIVSAYVIVEFIAINTQIIPGGLEMALKRQALLRPDDFEWYGRTGNMLRPNGLFGSRPHDTANFLGIVFVFWLAMLFRGQINKIKISLVVNLSLVGLLCTQSASNILAALVGALCVLIAYRKNFISYKRIVSVLIMVLTSIIVIGGLNYYGGIDLPSLWVWSERVNPEIGDWENMTNLGITYQWGDLYALLFGHGSSLKLSQIGDTTELAVLKILMELGLVHWIIFLSLLLYPIKMFFADKNRTHRRIVIPYVAAVFVGVLSLWHYGSVMRTTNIFIFFALYAQVLRNYSEMHNQHKAMTSTVKMN